MAVPPHDNCPGIPSLERVLDFQRRRFRDKLPEVYNTVQEIRAMDIKDAIEYMMWEKAIMNLAIMTLLEKVDPGTDYGSFMEKVISDMHNEVN